MQNLSLIIQMIDMRRLINSMEDLAPYVPNYVASVEGDRTLFEKMLPYLDEAELFLVRNVSAGISPDVLPAVSLPVTSVFRTIVATHALHAALAMLDVVVTPNGLGVVSTETIAPASAERARSMSKSLLEQRDRAIASAVDTLMQQPEWSQTEVAKFYLRSLIPLPSLTLYSLDRISDAGVYEDWKRYATRMSEIEDDLAIDTISTEVLELFRNSQSVSSSPKDFRLIRDQYRNICLSRLRGGKISLSMLEHVVEQVRNHPLTSAIWADSRAGEMHRLKSFENDKYSGGFFF